MTTNILGISAFYHDSAAALIRDGEIVAAAQEERFTRRKGDARFPSNAIAYCLNEGGNQAAQLDYVVFYEKPLVKFERLLETYLAFAPQGFQSFRQGGVPVGTSISCTCHKRSEPDWVDEFRGQLCFTDHHEVACRQRLLPFPI